MEAFSLKEKSVSKIRVAMIGCGGNGRAHVASLLKIPNVEVVALADTNEQSLAAARSLAPAARAYADYRKLLDEVDLDAVEISTPHTLHYQQITDALNRGLHVLCEKPMVCSTAHAKSVIALAKRKKKVLAIAYQRHCVARYRFIKRLIDDGEIGKVLFVNAFLSQEWVHFVRGTWRAQRALSGGGQLNDSGSHMVDFMLWATGLVPKRVSAFIENYDFEVDINSAVNVLFTNGAIGSLTVLGYAPMWWEDQTFVGEKGMITLRNDVIKLVRNGYETVQLVNAGADVSTDQNFVDAIQGKAEPAAPAICGLRVIQLTEAAWRSAEKGGAPVEVET